VKFAGEVLLSSKIHGITSEKISNDNHSENFRTHVYFVFSPSNKSVITVTLSVVLLLNFLTNIYTGWHKFPSQNNFDKFLLEIILQTRMCELNVYVTLSLDLYQMILQLNGQKPKRGPGPQVSRCSFIFTYLRHLNTQNNIVSKYISNRKSFLPTV